MTARTARLLPADDTGSRLLDLRSLEAHVRHYGAMPLVAVASAGKPGALVDELHTAGLRGRGGGWFPTSRKFHAVVESAAAANLRLCRDSSPAVTAVRGSRQTNSLIRLGLPTQWRIPVE